MPDSTNKRKYFGDYFEIKIYYEEVRNCFQGKIETYEFIFVNDGSQDKTMKKFNFKRLCALLLGLCSLFLFISFTTTADGLGVDYTKEYTMYLDIKEMSSLEDVESYLDNLNISYDINESKLTLPDYDSIEYVIKTDNSSVSVNVFLSALTSVTCKVFSMQVTINSANSKRFMSSL